MPGRIYRARLAGESRGRIYRARLAATDQLRRGRIYRATLTAPGSISMPAPRTVAAGALVTLTAASSGTATGWEWEQVSGPSVTLSGTDQTRTFSAPYLTSSQQVVLRARAMIGGELSGWASVAVTVSPHRAWAEVDGVLRPLLPGTPVPNITPSPGLWFQVPADIRTKARKVWAHYFGPYPRSINNAATIGEDNYSVYFNNPNYAPYAEKGSMYRDRPLFRAPIAGDYKLADCAWDIEQAKAAGIDGFMPDLLGLSGSNYDNYETLRAAALAANAADPGGAPFTIVPMVDANGATAAASAQAAAAYVKRFAIGGGGLGATPLSSAYYTPEGKFLFSAFKGEGKDLSYWSALIGYLQSDWGISAAFMPAYVSWSASANYASIQYGSGSWGYGADPYVINAASNQRAAAQARGEKHLAPICSQDVRPGVGSWFDEALNTSAQRAAWDKAIREGSEFAQIVTWSDFSETAVTPSAANGWSILDLHAWYIARWKTGSFPAIVRDAIILSHRSRTIGSTITGPQTIRLAQKIRGTQSPVTNLVEILTFLPSAATVEVSIGAASYSSVAPAGMGVRTYPLPGAVGAGEIGARVMRGSAISTEVASPVEVKSAAINDDFGYYRFASLRGTAGQFDPSTAY